MPKVTTKRRQVTLIRRRAARRAMLKMSAKIRCLWRPAQSGKTRTIMEMIRDNEEENEHLNIIICSNIRMLVSQTTARMKRDLFVEDEDLSDASSSVSTSSADSEGEPDDRIEGNVFSWMSGTKHSNIPTGELADHIKEGDVTMVVCCSHKKRFKYLIKLLENLEKSKFFTKPINVWIDEADASVKLWSHKEFDFTRFGKVSSVCLVSATFNSVVATYGRIKVLGFASTHPECYMPLKECNIVVQEFVKDPVGNLAAVLDAYPEVCRPGIRLFAPGLVEVASHDNIAEYLNSKGFAVLILNGQRKCIVCPNGVVIPINLQLDPTNPDEISKVLPALYVKHNLAQWPFAVTGQMCLGRGITFQDKDTFVFDYGILPDLADDATAYQCIARLLGNIKSEDGEYNAPTVFMSQAMKDVTLAMETVAINIAKKVHAEGWADVGEEEILGILREDDKTGQYENLEDKFDADWKLFDSLEDAQEFAPRVGHKQLKDDDGFYLTTTSGARGAYRMTEAEFEQIKAGKKTANSNAKTMKRDTGHRLYVWYRDITDPSSAVFVVRILTKKKPDTEEINQAVDIPVHPLE